jgi:hypothetical protein
MDWIAIAAGLLVASGGDGTGPNCAFPEALDLTYHLTGKRRLDVPGSKEGTCHPVKHEASVQVHGAEGMVRVHETGKKPPRGARLAACDEPFWIVAADEPRAWHRCPGGEEGAIHRARIRPSRTELPEGHLTVVLCGSKVAKVEVDLGLRWRPCTFDYQVDEPPADFAACKERLPPTTSRRSAWGSQPAACRE